MKELIEKRFPIGLAAAYIEDGGRVLFLGKALADGRREFELPCALVYPGDDAAMVAIRAAKQFAGLDCEVTCIKYQGKINGGSRKRKRLVPFMAFAARSKSLHAVAKLPYTSIGWMTLDQAKSAKLSRNFSYATV